MSLIPLNPTDDSAETLPRYDPQTFATTASTGELANFGFANDVTNSNDLLALSQPNFYRNSLDANGSVSISFSGLTNYVFVYQNVDSNWSLSSTISVGDTRDNLGYSLSFSKTTGEYLAIGTYNRVDASALFYVYVSDLGSPPTYTLQTTFTTGTFGTIANDTTNIGVKVQLNAAGDRLLAMGTTGIIEQFTRSGVTWTHETASTIAAIPTYATASAALIGLDANADHSVIVRGCPLFPVGAAFAAQTGQVDVFESSTTATQCFVGSAGDRIGAAVAISSNGLFLAYSSIGLAVELDLRVIDTSGYVNIYNKPSTYALQRQIVGTTVDAATGSFGSDIALSQLGNILIVGDAFANNYQGDQYLFTRNDDIWSLTYELGSTNSAAEVITLDATNNVIQTVASLAGETTTLTVGSYTGTTLAAEMTTEMTSQTAGTYTVTYDNVGAFFTLTRSTSTFNVDAAGTINDIIGIPSTTTLAASQTSSQLPSFAYNGTELGRNVNLSEGTAALVSGGLLGAEGPMPNSFNGLGKGILSVFTTEFNSFQNAVTIDDTNTEAFLVRKNNDGGDVFLVDTATGDGIVTSNGLLCANNTTDSTDPTVGSAVVKGGLGVVKSVFIGETLTVKGNATFEGDLIQNIPTDFIVVQKNTETTTSPLQVPHTVEIINDEMFLVGYGHPLTGSEIAITSISKADPAVVTTTAGHGFTGGETIIINGNDLNGPTANAFGVVGAGASGSTFNLEDSMAGNFDTTASSGGGLGGTVQETSSTDDLILVIYDISDPESIPTIVSNLSIASSGTQGEGMFVTGNYLFVNNQSSSVFIVDITDRSAPFLANTYTSVISAIRQSSGQGNYIFISNDTTTEIVDISNPLNPFIVSTTTPTVGTSALTQNVSRDHLYIGDERIFDISDIRNPTIVHDATTFFGGYGDVQGNYLYGVNTTVFWIRNISETDGFTSVASLPSIRSGGTFNEFVKVYGNYCIFLSVIGKSLTIVDVSDVSNPFFIFEYFLDVFFERPLFAISGNYLYTWVYSEIQGFLPAKLYRFTLPSANVPFLDSGSVRAGELSVRKSLNVGTSIHVNGPVQGMGSANFTGIGSNGINTLGTFSGTDNPYFTASNKRTGSFDLGDGIVAAGTTLGAAGTLLFTGHKMFVIEAFVAVDTTTPLLSNYRLVGVNESISGDAWSLIVTRNGTTDPLVVFAITAGTGQLTYSILAGYAGTFVTNTLYFEIVTDIQKFIRV
jgi:hypothetical protein